MVVESLELVENPPVFNFSLANPNLKLLGRGTGIPQPDMADIRINFIKSDWSLGVNMIMTGIEGETEAGNALAQGNGYARCPGECFTVGFERQDHSFRGSNLKTAT